jgi:hypothetical protein
MRTSPIVNPAQLDLTVRVTASLSLLVNVLLDITVPVDRRLPSQRRTVVPLVTSAPLAAITRLDVLLALTKLTGNSIHVMIVPRDSTARHLVSYLPSFKQIWQFSL